MTKFRSILYKGILPACAATLAGLWLASGKLREFGLQDSRVQHSKDEGDATPELGNQRVDQIIAVTSPPLTEPNDAQRLQNIPGASAAEGKDAVTLLALFNTGNFGKALQTAEDALNGTTSSAYRAWLKAQLPTLLTSYGWLLLKESQCEQGVQYLSRAERLGGGADATKGLAVCLYKLKDIPAAADKFAAYVAMKPQDFEMQLLYTDALESDQRFAEAFAVLDKLSRNQLPDDAWKLVLQKKDRMAARNRESSQQATTGTRHFVVSYRNAEHRDLAARVVEILEKAHDEFATSIGTVSLQTPIEVSLYPSTEFRDLAGGPSWADGMFDGRIRIPVTGNLQDPREVARLTRVIRHELVHALLAIQSDYRAIPTWFNEGLAQTMECEGRRCGFHSFPPIPGDLLSNEVLQGSFVTLDVSRATQAYAQSRYLVAIAFNDLGEEAMRQAIETISPASSLTSDGILKPAGTDFAALIRKAKDGWSKRLPQN